MENTNLIQTQSAPVKAMTITVAKIISFFVLGIVALSIMGF